MMKCCSQKSPHWRHFEIDVDLDYLVWYSPSKSVKKTRIELVNIMDVIKGQQSPGFKKCQCTDLVNRSFSIKYNGRKSLDLICITERDSFMWYHSLRQIINNVRGRDKWRQLRVIKLPPQKEKVEKTLFTSMNGKRWMKWVAELQRAQRQIWELLERSEQLQHLYGILFMRKRLKRQIHQLLTYEEETEESECVLQTQHDDLRCIRIEIAVLQYKVDNLLKENEKISKGNIFSNLFQFTSSSRSSVSSNAIFTPPLPQARQPRCSVSSASVYHVPQRIGSQRSSQAPSAHELSPFSLKDTSKRRAVKRVVLRPPDWYRCLHRDEKSLIREMMVDDICTKTLRLKTVRSVCSTFGVSQEDVEAVANYLDEKYPGGKTVNGRDRSRSISNNKRILTFSVPANRKNVSLISKEIV